MFQMTVDDVFVVRDNVAVSGKCMNRSEFTEILFDENGAEYRAHLPFIKHVLPPEADYITIELKNITNPHSLKGQSLKSLLH